MGWRVGVDSGGTFTDLCMIDEASGRMEIWKTSSTPDDPSVGIADVALQGLANIGAGFEDVVFFGHGTTVATNALIELKGSGPVLITTEGFRDLLEIGRQKRPNLYDMFAEKPKTLVSRDKRLEVDERIRHDGSVETPLTPEKIEELVEEIRAHPHNAIAVCLLYGYRNSAHEKALGKRLRDEFGTSFVSLSHEVAPEFREFERMTTTVVNAFLGPTMQRYIERLAKRLGDAGLNIAPNLTQSNGGVIGFDAAQTFPVKTLLSGPSTGVIAAGKIAQSAGFDDIITFDVGGTSSDVALLKDGVCNRTGEADVHGYPIKAPMLDIHTVGAGGGSIAYVDTGGLLKVGPKSAGADPGPVCYGRGGRAPTVTDANIVLQTLNPEAILGGRMKVRRDLAVSAIQTLADKLGLSLQETAQGILAVATANMAKAIRVISVQRGYDPRDYALMAFGGGGPLHAARLAKELDMARVIVPTTPGALCALGLLMTDLLADFAQSVSTTLVPEALEEIENTYRRLEEKAGEWFVAEGVDPELQVTHRTVDLRYAGQNYELSIAFPTAEQGTCSLSELRERFDLAHKQRFGFSVDGETIEIVTLRVGAAGLVKKAELPKSTSARTGVPTRKGTRSVWLPEAGGEVECPIYDRDALHFGHAVKGPAIVEQMDTTTLILPDMTAQVDAYRNLVLEFDQ